MTFQFGDEADEQSAISDYCYLAKRLYAHALKEHWRRQNCSPTVSASLRLLSQVLIELDVTLRLFVVTCKDVHNINKTSNWQH